MLLYLGTLSGHATIITGLIAKSLIADSFTRDLIETHQWWGIGSIAIYSLSSVFYIGRKDTKVLWVLALLGVLGLFITGGLGGSIAFGPTIDPITNQIYNWFY